MLFKKCLKCGSLVMVLKDSGITCCGSLMVPLVANSTDASFEKHVPTYEIRDNELYIVVNHVMEENHYIEWILVEYPNGELRMFNYKPFAKPECVVPYVKGSIIYSYCNLHDLWKAEV